MSDKHKNKRSLLTDFFRYNRDELSGEERNSFERELQKDPFAEEAAEGFASISHEEAFEDIKYLEKRLGTRTARRQKLIIYRIAASIAILMMITTIFIFIEKNKPSKQIAQNSVQAPVPEITKSQPSAEPAKKDISPEKKFMIAEKKAEKPVSEKIAMGPVKSFTPAEKPAQVANRMKDSIPAFKVEPVEAYVAAERIQVPSRTKAKERSFSLYSVKGKVLSSEDNMPLPGANVFIRGTHTGAVTDSDGNFNISLPDSNRRTLVVDYIGMDSKQLDVTGGSQVQVKLDPSVSALSEVVVVGYGVKKAESFKEDESTGHVPSQPKDGKSQFDKYIQNNLHRPDSATKGQRVVVIVSFLVRTDGSIDSMKIVRSPGKEFADEAIRVIKSGPPWKPAEENGKPVEDVVRVRIVFR